MAPPNATNPRRSNTAPRIAHRALPWVTVAGAVLAALVMALSPVTAASHVSPALKAPYTKTSVILGAYTDLGGCGSANVTHAPGWSATTGVGKEAVKASTKTCGGYFGALHVLSSSYTQAYFDTALSVHPTASTTLVQATWNFKAAGSGKIAYAGTCPSPTYYDTYGNATSDCYTTYDYLAEWEVVLVDTTNGSDIGGASGLIGYNSSYYELSRYCVSYSCTGYTYANGGTASSFSVSTTNTTDIYGPFIGSHKYQLIGLVVLYTEAESGWYNYPQTQPGGTWSSTASASINMATGGDQATLSSVKLL